MFRTNLQNVVTKYLSVTAYRCTMKINPLSPLKIDPPG